MDEQQLSLPELFLTTNRLLHRYHRVQRHKEEGFDPRQGQGRILALLKKADNLTQKELAYLLNIRQQSLGELLRKLEQGGYITREPSQKDKRAMMIRLTEKGKALEFQEFDFKEVFSCLNEAEQEQMAQYLERISNHLREMLQDTEEPLDLGPRRCRPDHHRGPLGPRPRPLNKDSFGEDEE